MKKTPLQPVVDATIISGRCPFNTSLHSRYWLLQLACGKQEERPVRFPSKGGMARKGWSAMRNPQPESEALPPPKKLRCSNCTGNCGNS